MFGVSTATVATTFLLLEAVALKVSGISVSHIVDQGKPFLLYGTAWKKERTATLVNQAVHAGFRCIDTACQPKHYNEAGVGEGWSSAAFELGLTREDFFLQSKFTPTTGQDPNNIPYDPQRPVEEQIRTSIAVSLENLNTEYIDSFVLHGPLSTLEETASAWSAMEEYVDQGVVRRLGISNCYDYNYFADLHNMVRVKPSILQNRLWSESDFDTKLRQFCQNQRIRYQSFWTLTANFEALEKPEVKEWASAKNLTPQTYMYAFLMSLGQQQSTGYLTPLSGTTSEEHMAEDVAVMKRLQGGEEIFDSLELERMAKLLGFPAM